MPFFDFAVALNLLLKIFQIKPTPNLPPKDLIEGCYISTDIEKFF